MAPLLEDPRFRQTWNTISQNAGEATETAATSIWTFQHRYLTPCVSSIGACFEQCIPSPSERTRHRARTRGRAELSFDFYDDWDEDERAGGGGILGWGNDELDRLLAGSGSGGHGHEAGQPRRKRGMSYGTRNRGGRRKSLEADPTVIPSTNSLGFLGRLPFKLGGTLRYKPSAADLQEHPGQSSRVVLRDDEGEEGEPLIDESDEEDEQGGVHGDWKGKGHRRNRSSTASSGETSDSFRSRGDIFPSDGEDDAVPLDDEFAMVLERRMTGEAGGKAHKGKRPAGSRTMSRTMSRTTQHSSRSRPGMDGNRSSSAQSLPVLSDQSTPDMVEAPSFTDLQQEEERVRVEEDGAIERKRQAAARLAVERGLSLEPPSSPVIEAKDDEEEIAQEEAEESNYGEASEVLEIAPPEPTKTHEEEPKPKPPPKDNFNPANLPHFG